MLDKIKEKITEIFYNITDVIKSIEEYLPFQISDKLNDKLFNIRNEVTAELENVFEVYEEEIKDLE